MRFENAFDVQAPAAEVWQALMDVERVAPCMPGAEVLERLGEDSYRVGVRVKLGPMTMNYRGQVEIVERDDAGLEATMRAKAKEARGQGTADADVHMALSEQDGATHATIATEMAISGKAAAMGQGVIGDVAQRLVQEFASNLASMLAPSEAADGGGRPGGGEPPAEAPFPGATPPPPAQEPAALPAGRIAADVIKQRLRDPRIAAFGALLVLALLIRRLIRRPR